MPFSKETARLAGKKSKRGKAKISLTMRHFLFDLLNENKAKFKYMLEELSPREFVTVYLKLVPYIITMRHLQKFNVSELSIKETQDFNKNLIDGD